MKVGDKLWLHSNGLAYPVTVAPVIEGRPVTFYGTVEVIADDDKIQTRQTVVIRDLYETPQAAYTAAIEFLEERLVMARHGLSKYL